MADSPSTPDQIGPVPGFGARRLLLVVTGSLSAVHVPGWTNWLRIAYPDLERRIVLTRGATRFVTPDALSVLDGRRVELDTWPEEPGPGSPHVELATWPDVILVYPATFHFLSRFALGLGDTPVTLALQCTSALVGLAPSLPPGAADSPAYRRHTAHLRSLTNVVLADPVRGRSVHTGEFDASAAVPLPELIDRVEERRRALREAEAPC